MLFEGIGSFISVVSVRRENILSVVVSDDLQPTCVLELSAWFSFFMSYGQLLDLCGSLQCLALVSYLWEKGDEREYIF